MDHMTPIYRETKDSSLRNRVNTKCEVMCALSRPEVSAARFASCLKGSNHAGSPGLASFLPGWFVQAPPPLPRPLPPHASPSPSRQLISALDKPLSHTLPGITGTACSDWAQGRSSDPGHRVRFRPQSFGKSGSRGRSGRGGWSHSGLTQKSSTFYWYKLPPVSRGWSSNFTQEWSIAFGHGLQKGPLSDWKSDRGNSREFIQKRGTFPGYGLL